MHLGLEKMPQGNFKDLNTLKVREGTLVVYKYLH